MWFVTRRSDVLAVLRDPETYRTDSPRSTIRDTFGTQMLSAEGELHRRFKSQCNPPFNMRSVHGHAMPLITARADALIDGFAEDRSTDLRPSLASQLAVYTVASVLCLSRGPSRAHPGWYASFAAALANFTWDEQIRARGHASAREFQDAIAPVMRDLERTSDSSLLGALTRANAATRLTDPEIIPNALIVLFGGIETTESTILNVIGHCCHTRPHSPRSGPMVRCCRQGSRKRCAGSQRCSPAPATFSSRSRSAASPLVPGATIQCMLGAANRDPDHFPDPDRYDITRANAGDYISFGAGKHFCLGAALARAEVLVATERLLQRFPTLRLDPDRPSAPRGFEFRAPPTLHVLLGD